MEVRNRLTCSACFKTIGYYVMKLPSAFVTLDMQIECNACAERREVEDWCYWQGVVVRPPSERTDLEARISQALGVAEK